jgi:Na+/melibiose symporter-like transporter
LALGFAALWFPPAQVENRHAHVLLWLGCSLLLTYLAFSLVSMVHQAWAARWGGQPEQRARLVAWREGATLLGVLLASVLPLYWGLQTTSLILALGLALGLWALRQTLPLQTKRLAAHPSSSAALLPPPSPSPWRTPAFSALLLVFLLNGTASAVPATLLPFFVRDTLQASSLEPLFLASYFLAAALGLPLWVQLVRRIGLARSWLLGMGLSVLAFCAVPWLDAGDAWAFGLICILTGLALGADLAVPSALLTGLIHHAGLGQHSEGRFFGWWAAASKLNLALAAGLALPLLGWLGFQTGQHSAGNQFALAITYGLLPCVFKVLAAACLCWAMQRHPVLKGSI